MAKAIRVRDGWEVLTDWSRLSAKATRFMRAMVVDAPRNSIATERYRGTRRGLMLYGPGAPDKLPVIRGHVAAGGIVAMWDMGYWERKDAMRLSVNDLHPTPAQLNASPLGGRGRGFALREDADAGGPILLVGLGRKSVFAYNLPQDQGWERNKVADLRRRFPERKIFWRPKGEHAAPLMDLPLRHGMPIEEAMAGCSLVVSHHSNASVDAALAGVPFETECGAAIWLQKKPFTVENRRAFLERLSYWEWSRFEAGSAWQWVEIVTR